MSWDWTIRSVALKPRAVIHSHDILYFFQSILRNPITRGTKFYWHWDSVLGKSIQFKIMVSMIPESWHIWTGTERRVYVQYKPWEQLKLTWQQLDRNLVWVHVVTLLEILLLRKRSRAEKGCNRFLSPFIGWPSSRASERRQEIKWLNLFQNIPRERQNKGCTQK